MAKALGKCDDCNVFNERGYWWKNAINPETGYAHMRRANGEFVSDFDPFLTGRNQHYVEGNAWQLTFFVSKDPIKMKDALDLVLHNRDMQMYTIAAASDKLALQTASNSAITVMIFGIIIGNYKFNASLNLVNMFVTLALLFFFVSRLAGKSGLKKANILWTSTTIAMYALMWVFLLCVDTLQITVNPVLKVVFIVLYCAMGASKMATSCVSNPLRYDIIDYEFSRSGRYMPALVNTVYSFIDKLISSLASTIVALSVAMIGYTEGMPQATDELTSGVFWVGTFLWLGVPIIGYVCTLVAMRWYKLDKKTMDEVQRKNAELRAAQKDAK